MSRPRKASTSDAAAAGPQRVQKILASAGIASRRKSEELISQGRVTVNGRIVVLGEKADPESDAIKVDGKRLKPRPQARYLLLNKPRGCLSTVSDPEKRPTVMDFIPVGLHRGLHPVGRLDFNTEGLLLLTTDGDWSQRVAHPSHGCTKTYEVKVKGMPEQRVLDRLRRGIVLDGRRTAPCEITLRPGRGQAKTSWWIVRLAEGRTRQIREMFLRCGHPVQRLRRVSIGSLRDSTLALGGHRELLPAEVEALRRGTEASRRTPNRRRPRAKR